MNNVEPLGKTGVFYPLFCIFCKRIWFSIYMESRHHWTRRCECEKNKQIKSLTKYYEN